MPHPLIRTVFAMVALAVLARGGTPTLEQGFAQPTAEVRPWVFWFWADGNVTRQGITADLEAMKRVGIGGVVFMEVDQNVPKGPVRFMSPAWRELMAFAISEATRLGLSFDLNNDAGWCGSGGPWVTAADSMQKVVWAEEQVTGPVRFDAALPVPVATAGFYRDIAVLAYPTPTAATPRIDRYVAKSGLALAASPTQDAAEVPAACIPSARILDLTSQVRAGRLTWEVPAGNWTVVRFGHTSTGVTNHPAPAEGTGFEVDKLSRPAFDRHYDAFAGKLIRELPAAAAKALTAVHIDSWEVGYQNWTEDFRAAFQQRRGYDPVPWLPAFTGRAVESAALSERFLWDVRRTVSELLVERYAGGMAARAHAQHRRFTVEAYRYGPFDCLSYAGRADVPVGEFWMTKQAEDLHPSVKTMASAGHIYGRPVIAAEAFTATDAMASQRNHPYTMKAIGDAAFCAGINHFIIHRYALQPWTDDRKPGMTMGPWGVEYERTATWWEQTKPWHEYLARCQYLLRQGRVVADLCYLQAEEGYNNPAVAANIEPAVPDGYDFDFCSDEVLRTTVSVRDGRLTLPDGMQYRVLVLPPQRLMTPPLLRKIRDLVRGGAIVYGPPPLHSPSLSGYPKCDAEVRALVAELWGPAGATVAGPRHRSAGRGQVIWGCTLADLLKTLRLDRDFAWRADGGTADSASVHYLHRRVGDRDLYFVANLGDAPARITASFRVAHATPELWDAETGARQPAVIFQRDGARVQLPLELTGRGSIFVVFRPAVAGEAHFVALNDGRAAADAGAPLVVRAETPPPRARPTIADTFTMAAWVNPTADTTLGQQDRAGTAAYSVPRNDVLFPPPVHDLLGRLDVAGAGFAAGRNGVTVLEHGDHLFAATLVYRAPLSGWTHLAVVFDHGVPTLFVNGSAVGTGVKTALTVYAGVGVKHSREVAAYRGEHSVLRQWDRALTPAEVQAAMREMPATAEATEAPPTGMVRRESLPPLLLDRWPALWATQTGRYTLADDKNATQVITASVPAPLPLPDAWTVHFSPEWGGPERLDLPQLASWTENRDPGVRYYSGTAQYETVFRVDSDVAARRFWLDLGEVHEIAEVTLNGRPVGTLWKPPFRTEVTDALRPGENHLSVKVTNLWVNRLIGDEQLPPDREWTTIPHRGGQALKQYPEWLARGERSPVGRFTFTTWKHYEKDAPLLPSGLIGPVVLTTAVRTRPLAQESTSTAGSNPPTVR